MALVTYPLNNIDYPAEDAELFHVTRTSGIYAKDSFGYSMTGTDNNIVIGTGIGWIKNGEFSGKVVAQKEPISLNMGLSDPVYPSIDAIVIQFNANKNETNIVVKKGVAATSPVAPSVVRTESVYELHLYHVRREAGSLYIAAGNITDLRLNEDYCGLMADSVTKVDTAAIEAQINALISDLKDKYAEIPGVISHIGNKSNPHGVTKSQVGLGNVPNVATNDQTPTFTAASTLKTLTSGEKLSVAFGKLAKAITDLISHIGNKSNPHGITASQIGAAADNHSQAINTITGLTDYVIANGSSGAWTYWKFNSGLCIAMGNPTVSWGTPTAVATNQNRSTAALNLTGIFTAVMGGTCSNAHRHVNCFVIPSGGTSAELWATTAVATGTLNVSNFSTTPRVVLFGKWK